MARVGNSTSIANTRSDLTAFSLGEPFKRWGRRIRGIWHRIRLRRELRALSRKLEQLESWQLKDIGLSRGDIGAIANGSYFSDTTRRARTGQATRIKKET